MAQSLSASSGDYTCSRPSLLGRLVQSGGWFLVLLPTLAFFLVFFIYPLLYIVERSAPEWSFSNYTRIFSTWLYARVILSTFKTALIVSFVCLVMGYAYAYALVKAKGLVLGVLSVALLLPFWVSVLLRTFSWLVLLQDSGLINRVLLGLGIVDTPVSLIRNQLGVVIGMSNLLLPYMVMPLATVMRGVDSNIIAAARISGASSLRTFFRVYLPMTMPGVLSGFVLTMTLSMGFYITPAVLGGSRNVMIAQLIADQINQQVNFTFSSALAVVLIVFSSLAFGTFGILVRIAKRKVGEA
ncbi:ABC transporter permease [Paraburkholderia sp. BCC1885]|uniref:ABC transporter permease n=1 Tax=Paraburkholderia sp. BCC1885 TaxID=2562669 RepID=UPI0011841259|nr:ABC transporter permease [Paraburkholderia sp. BCC1885]